MIEFNADGSIKLPGAIEQKKHERESRMHNTRCILFEKEVVSFESPKKCVIHMKLSNKFTDDSFLDNIYKHFSASADVPTKLVKKADNEFDLEIGTSWRRCSECSKIITKFKEYLDGNAIEHNGNCTYEPRTLCYEDYF